MANYDLYGLLSTHLCEAKDILEDLLDIKFEDHESSYQAGSYFKNGNSSGEHFVLKRNLDPFDDEPAEVAFPKHPILFYVNDSPRSEYLQKILSKKSKTIVLLRHEYFL
ncbi:MAG: hypothetical protein GZ090_07470 [Oxalobacteraceae bacterium]|nr:hypothetical protein [Oxalobacteraceae bacterium]